MIDVDSSLPIQSTSFTQQPMSWWWTAIIPIFVMLLSASPGPQTLNQKNVLPIFPSQTFTAEYEVEFSDDPRGPDRRRISCNGNKQFIYEWNKLRFLYDGHKNIEFIIDPSGSRVYIHRMRDNGASWLEEQMFLKSPYNSFYFSYLGEETLGEHQCRVYGNKSSEKRYYDKNTRLLVLQKVQNPCRTYTAKLIKYSSQALPPSDFTVPKHFHVRDRR